MLYFFIGHLVAYWGMANAFCNMGVAKFSPPPKVALNVVVNQIIFTPVLFYALQLDQHPMFTVSSQHALISLATLKSLVLYIPIYYIAHCVYFYATHRLCHNKFLYKHVHWVHHQYKQTFPYAAAYAHPTEAHHITAQHSTVSTAQHGKARHSAAQHRTAGHSTAQHSKAAA